MNESIKINEDFIPFGSFISEDYKSINVPEYDLQLCKLTEEPIAELHNIENFTMTKGVLSVNEISFEVHKYIYTSSGNKKPNPLFDLVEGNMLVFVDKMDYFILSKPQIVTSGRDMPIKTIKGFSREYELSQKIIDDFKGNSRVLYDESNSKDENGIEYGYLNYIENNTSWTVGYYNKDINKKHRALNLSGNILRSTDEVQKAFGCVFVYDTIDKLIHVYDPMQLGVDRGIYISDENYINELTQDIEDESIVTRLYLYGNENISVNSLTPTGQPFIQDFSYYKNTKYMTQGLIDGLNAFDDAVNNNMPTFQNLLKEEIDVTEHLTLARVNLREQEGKLRILEHEWDTIVAEDGSLTAINNQIEKQKSVVATHEAEVGKYEEEISTIAKKKKSLQSKLDLRKFLTDKEIKELDYFIKEEKFFDNNYTRENIQELLEEGTKVLSQISKPKLTFKVSVDDFLRMAEGRFMWHRFRLGDIITLEHKEAGFDYKVRLIGYTHTPDEHMLELKFSSVDSLYDSAIYLEEILEEAIDVSNTVDFNKFKWDKGEDVSNEFSEYINHNLDLSNQALSKADGQKPMLDDRGLWLYKEMPDGSVSPEQVRAINNVIAITKDNWKTVEWALTPNGIMAKQLIGDMILGTDLKIISDTGVVEILNNLITIRDTEGRTRVMLGNYADGKYGLQLKDKDGNKTILDEDGILQVWQEGRTDNVDGDNGLKLSVYIPENARFIYDAQLRYTLERFRSYSSTTDTEEAVYDTTGWEGSIYKSTGGGGEYLNTTGDGGGEMATAGLSTDVVYDYGWVHEGGDPAHRHKYRYVIDHQHLTPIEDHVHSISIPEHYHSVVIDGHDHSITIPAHSHEILPVISTHRIKPNKCTVHINGVDRTYAISGRMTLLGDQDSLDITNYLTRGRWNTIEIRTDTLGRIDATIFVQTLISFNFD